MIDNNLAAPCGIYCGACRSYLLKKKDLLEERGYKQGCDGCRIRFKKCAFIRRDCLALRKKELEYCYECDDFPCNNLERIDTNYVNSYNVSPVNNLKRLQEIGLKAWFQEKEALYKCPKCGGEICVHDAECFDCGSKINPNIG